MGGVPWNPVGVRGAASGLRFRRSGAGPWVGSIGDPLSFSVGVGEGVGRVVGALTVSESRSAGGSLASPRSLAWFNVVPTGVPGGPSAYR